MMREGKTSGAPLLERPLSARSLVASLLLRSEPPRMRGSRLVRWCGLFGVAEGTTRVALSRMVDRGELRAADGVYELAGPVHARRGAQDWSLDPQPSAWRGTWRTAIVVAGARGAGDRASLRDTMRRLHYGVLREGVWTRPDNLPRAAAPAEWWDAVDEQCSWWTGRPEGDARALADELFANDAWSARARALERRLDDATHALETRGERAIADGFVAGAAAVAHLRADPLLPPELAGADADAGAALRRAYRAYERGFSVRLREWFLSEEGPAGARADRPGSR